LPERSSTEAYDVASLVRALSYTLGEEQAAVLVREAMRELGLLENGFSQYHWNLVLRALSRQTGLAGMAARHLLSRLAQAPSASAPPAVPRTAEAPHAIRRADVVAMFAPALGDEGAKELVDGLWRAHPSGAEAITPREAAELLERAASEPGIVGITARFAKARLALTRHG
jgi:hypothetical protein